MSLSDFLADCLDLFSATFYAVFGVPILRFFAVFGLFLAILTLLASLVRQGRKGKL